MQPGFSPRLLEELLSGVPAFLFLLAPDDLALLAVSEGVRALTGYEARDLLARPALFVARIPREDRDAWGGLRGEDRRGSPTAEFRFRGADEGIRRFRAQLALSGGFPGIPSAIAGIAWPIEGELSARRDARTWRSVLESAGAPILFADLSGKIALWNAAAASFLGWSADELVGNRIDRLFAIPSEAVKGLLRRVLEEGTVIRDDRLVTRSGDAVECRTTITLVRGADGKPLGVVAAVAGTAERKGLESRLHELVTRLRTIERVNRIIASDWDIGKVHGRIAVELEKLVDFERTSLCVFEEGGDPILVQACAKGPTRLGSGARVPLERSAPGWVLTHRMTRIDEDMAASSDRFVENEILVAEGMRSRLMIPLFAGERIVGTLNFNSRRKGAYSPSTVEDLGTIPDQMALAIDKHHSYAMLRSSEERYRFLFEQGPPAAILRPDGRFVDVNAGCLDLFGYTREEFLRLSHTDLAPRPEKAIVLAEFLKRTGELEREVRARRKDGTVFWGSINLFPVSPDLLLGQIIDITRQRELENQLRHAQKMEAIGTLAGGVAHDFNNIIQTILGFANLLGERLRAKGDATDEIAAIERGASRAAELTGQLLGFARGGKYDVRPTDLNAVVGKVASMVRHTFDRAIEVQTGLAPDLRMVEGDPGQLEHTLLNLCINARDAMSDGGILRITTHNDLPAGLPVPPNGAAAGFVTVSVSDTGVGIPAANIPRIFEPFFTTKEPGKGTGMGLAMAYGIVKNHGGTIDVRSEVGRGTTFDIVLPATARRADGPQEPAPPKATPGGTETILFIDDEESLRLLAGEALGVLGYTVLTAQNGVEAIEMYSRAPDRIALVILDMVMPEMGGEETFSRIRAINPTARILLSSGYTVEERSRSLLSEGAAGFLQKPYRLAALAEAVRKAIG